MRVNSTASGDIAPVMRELSRALTASAISRALAIPAALALNGLLARQLPIAEFAYLGVLISISVLATLLLQFGYQTSIVKTAGEAAHSGDLTELDAALAAGTITLMITTVLAVPVFLFFSSRLLPGLGTGGPDAGTILLSVGFVASLALNIFFTEAIRGLGKVGTAASLTGMGQHGGIGRILVMMAGLLVLLVADRVTLASVLWTGIGASLAMSFASLFLLVKVGVRPVSWRTTLMSFRENLTHNSTVLAVQSFQSLSSYVAAAMVGGALLPVDELAHYIAAQQLIILINAPLALFNGSSPKLIISSYRSGDTRTLEKLLRVGSTMAFLVALCMSMILLLGGRIAVEFIFGPKFGSAFVYLVAMMPGAVAMTFGGGAARSLLLLGFERSQIWLYGLFCPFALSLFYLSGREWGGLGLACAVSLALLILNGFQITMARQRLGVWTYAYLSPARFAALGKAGYRAFRSRTASN